MPLTGPDLQALRLWTTRASAMDLGAACVDLGVLLACGPASRDLADDRFRLVYEDRTDLLPSTDARRQLSAYLLGYCTARPEVVKHLTQT